MHDYDVMGHGTSLKDEQQIRKIHHVITLKRSPSGIRVLRAKSRGDIRARGLEGLLRIEARDLLKSMMMLFTQLVTQLRFFLFFL